MERIDHLESMVQRARCRSRRAQGFERSAVEQARSPGVAAGFRCRARELGDQVVGSIYRLDRMANNLDEVAERHRGGRIRGEIETNVRIRVQCRRRAAQLRHGARRIIDQSTVLEF